MKPHAIMITIPYQGHVSPFVGLALKLASKGFKVTFINTEHVHRRITKSIITNSSNNGTHNNVSDTADIFAEARDSAGLDIHYRTISDGFPLDYDRDGNFAEFWESLLKDFPSTVEDFVGKILSESSSSAGDGDSLLFPILVADSFSPWAGKIAEKHKLVNVSFWTQPSLVFATCYYMELLIEHGHFPPKDDDRYDNIDYIPGIESISRKDLPSYFNYEAAETLHIVQKIVFSSFDEANKADFILHNTVQELEPRVLSSLNQTKPTYSIGPTNFYKEIRETIVPKSFFRETDCSKWLDTKPYRSVLYISFGSLVSAEKHVIEELARGLVLSEANFLWITRNHSDNGSSDNEGVTFPLGFRDEVNDKGLIVPWCDQTAVLSHRAIGGFLTHCGWNSVLEGMWFGVPMICYPVDYDQPTNRKLAVDDWKIGLNLCEEEETINAEKIAEKIKKVMNSTGENEMKREDEEIMKTLHNALDDDGSSERNFNRFVDDLKDKIDQCVGNGI